MWTCDDLRECICDYGIGCRRLLFVVIVSAGGFANLASGYV